MTEQMNVPKLRFGEFEGEWNRNIFNDISVITRLAGYEYSTYWEEDPKQEIIALRGYNIGSNKLLLRDLGYISDKLSKQLSRSRLAKGDIVYPCVGTIGNSTVIDEDDKYHIQQNIAKITCNEKTSPYYVSQFLSSFWGMREVYKFNATSSQPNVLVGSLRNFKISLPKLPEQQKIASFLSKADEKIGLLSEKKDKLTEYKRGVMQQLFNGKWHDQDGQLTFTPPTLRFKADDGSEFPDWEEKKLGEVFSISAGGDIDKKHSNKVRTDKFRYPIFANAETNKGLYGYSDVYKVDQPCITVSGRGSLGNAVYRNEAFYPIVRLLVLKPQFALNLKFFEQTINKLNIYNESTGVPQLTAPQLKTYRVLFPSTNEQDKIASFLTLLEQKIGLVNSELETAKEWKKGLLQQMFV